MAITTTRTVSDSTSYVAFDRDAAIALALAGNVGNATVVPRISAWPELVNYTNNNGVVGDPQYIWDSTTSDGQSRGFAARSNAFSGFSNYVISLTTFCDNAHSVRIDIYELPEADPILLETLTPPVLIDGNMDPITGLTEVQPYNWQSVRIYTIASSTLSTNNPHIMIFSFTGVNYNVSSAGAPNPAGIVFSVDIVAIPSPV